MKQSVLKWVVVGVVVLGGVALFAGGQLRRPAAQPDEQVGLQGAEMSQEGDSVTIQLLAQSEPQSGTALIRSASSGSEVILDVTPREGGAQPAHIHSGSCGDIGGIKYPLSDVVNGRSETMLDVSFSDLTSDIPFAINIHRSVQEANVYTSCGDVTNPLDN